RRVEFARPLTESLFELAGRHLLLPIPDLEVVDGGAIGHPGDTFLLAGDHATQTPQVALTDQDHPRTAHHAMNHVHLLVGRHSRLDHPVTPHVLQDHHATPHTSVQHLVLNPLSRTCEHDETDEEGHRQTLQWPQAPGAGPDTDTDEDGEDQQ